MSDNLPTPERSWADKFRDAFRGVKEGVRRESSFFVHIFIAVAVIATAAVLKIDNLAEWAVLLICIAAVLSAEMFNTALESLARAITDEFDPHVGRALDISSGAVLIASTGAAIIGTVIFANRLAMMMGWW